MAEGSLLTFKHIEHFLRYTPLIRDIEILNSIRLLGPITRMQIQRRHFPCRKKEHVLYCECGDRRGYTAVLRRLHKLREEAGYIIGHRMQVDRYTGQGRLYTLAPRYEYCLLSTEAPPFSPSSDRKLKRKAREKSEFNKRLMKSGYGLAHHLFCNDLLIWFQLSQECAKQFFTHLNLSYTIHGELYCLPWQKPRPDLLINLSFKNKTPKNAVLYVEADRGTETVPRLSAKIFEYRKLLEASKHAVLLIVFDRQQRLHSDYVCIAATLQGYGLSNRVWFTVYDQLDWHKKPFVKQNALLDPIWFAYDNTRPNGLSRPFGLRYRFESSF